MPVIHLDFEELERLVGAPAQKIIERIPMIGADVERVEDGFADVEFFPDRPDMYSVEGVARAMRGFLGIETGAPKYRVSPSEVEMRVEPSVKQVRPLIVCAVVRDIEMSDPLIESMMHLQEHLHWGLGRNRRKVSIGIHDLSKVESPFTYKTVDENFSFIPLDFDEEMTIKEILEKHPKGRAFSFILKDFNRYPVIVDRDGNVLSFPPIINGELTRVTERTRELFIDVTGTEEVVSVALNIIVTALAERGFRIQSVEIIDGKRKFTTPDLSEREVEVSIQEIRELIGVPLSEEECISALRKMRFDAELQGEKIKVRIPAYRADIMHPWDIIEDVAIGYGYERIPSIFPEIPSISSEHEVEKRNNRIREVMIGLGFTEVMTFTLTSERVHFEMIRREGSALKIANPASEEQRIFRSSILPMLMEALSMNRHYPMPQRIFEVGDVIVEERRRNHIAGVSMHANADFSEIKSVVIALLRELGYRVEIFETKDPAFIEGRVARLEGDVTGVFGEVHPEVLVNFDLDHPVSAFEIELPY